MHSQPYQQSHKTAVHPLGAHVTPLTRTYPLHGKPTKKTGTTPVLNILYCTMVRKNRWYFLSHILLLNVADPSHFVALMDPDADPSIFIIDLQDAKKN
jgi:hypothetical protein